MTKYTKKTKLLFISLLLISISIVITGLILRTRRDPDIDKLPRTGSEEMNVIMQVDEEDVQLHDKECCTQDIEYTINANNLECMPIPVDVMLILDRTGSMNDDNDDPEQPLTAAKNAMIGFIDLLNPVRDLVGLVSYNETPVLEYPLSSNFEAIKASIAPINAEGYTNIGDAISTAASQSPSIIILLSDGNPNRPEGIDVAPDAYAISHAQIAKDNGSRIISIGLGNNVSQDFLRNVSSGGEFDYYYSPSGNNLDAIYRSIAFNLQDSPYPISLEVDLANIQNIYTDVVAEGSIIKDGRITWELSEDTCGEFLQRNFMLTLSESVQDETNVVLNSQLYTSNGISLDSNTVTSIVHSPIITMSYENDVDPQNNSYENSTINIQNTGSGNAYGIKLMNDFDEASFVPVEDSINHEGIIENGIIYWDNTGENFELSGSYDALDGVPTSLAFTYSGNHSDSSDVDLYSELTISTENGCFQGEYSIPQEGSGSLNVTGHGNTQDSQNTPNTELPATGISNQMLYRVIGISLMLSSAYVMYKRKNSGVLT